MLTSVGDQSGDASMASLRPYAMDTQLWVKHITRDTNMALYI